MSGFFRAFSQTSRFDERRQGAGFRGFLSLVASGQGNPPSGAFWAVNGERLLANGSVGGAAGAWGGQAHLRPLPRRVWMGRDLFLAAANRHAACVALKRKRTQAMAIDHPAKSKRAQHRSAEAPCFGAARLGAMALRRGEQKRGKGEPLVPVGEKAQKRKGRNVRGDRFASGPARGSAQRLNHLDRRIAMADRIESNPLDLDQIEPRQQRSAFDPLGPEAIRNPLINPRAAQAAAGQGVEPPVNDWLGEAPPAMRGGVANQRPLAREEGGVGSVGSLSDADLGQNAADARRARLGGAARSPMADAPGAARATTRSALMGPTGLPVDREGIELLNRAIATEVVCALRYTRCAVAAKGINSKAVAAEFYEHAEEEWKHMQWLAERVGQMGGDPNLEPAGLDQRSHCGYRAGDTLHHMIEANLTAERQAVAMYRGMIARFGDDPTTRRLLEKILAEEEEHADDLSALIEG